MGLELTRLEKGLQRVDTEEHTVKISSITFSTSCEDWFTLVCHESTLWFLPTRDLVLEQCSMKAELSQKAWTKRCNSLPDYIWRLTFASHPDRLPRSGGHHGIQRLFLQLLGDQFLGLDGEQRDGMAETGARVPLLIKLGEYLISSHKL